MTQTGRDDSDELFPLADDALFQPSLPHIPAPLEDEQQRHLIPPASVITLDADAKRDLKQSQDRLGDALPRTGWLAEFVRMAVPMTSAPTEFHLAAGLTAIAAVLGNRVRMRNWNTTIYPHLWTLVVAPTGNSHKTTSVNMASDLLYYTSLGVKLSDDFSRESLLLELSEKPAGLLKIDEFATLLLVGKKDYGQGMLADLTRVYDSQHEWKRKLMTREFVVRRPALSIFAATTIDWLQELVTPADLRSGFIQRFLFVTAAQKNTDRKRTADIDQLTQNRLVAGLERLSRVAPPIEPSDRSAMAVTIDSTPEAADMWDKWLDKLQAEIDNGNHPGYLVGFLNRLQTYGLKLAMIYRASACAFDPSANALIVDAEAQKAAIAYCDLIWQNTVALFENEWADSKEARELQHVEESIGRGCFWTEALRRTHMRAMTFRPLVETLIESERIEVEDRVQEGRERNRTAKWLKPGPKHHSVMAQKRNKPKPAWADDWDAEAAAERPITIRVPKGDNDEQEAA